VLGNVVHDYFAEKMKLESDKPPTLDAASVTLQHVNVTRALDIGQVTDHTAASLTTALTTLHMSPAVISKLVAILGTWGQTQVASIETFRLSLLAAKPADKAALRAQFKVSGTVSSTQARRAYIGYNWAAIKDVILEAALGPPRDSIADQLAGPLEPIMGALPELLADLDLVGFALDVVFMALRAAVEKILDGVKVTLFGEDASDDIGSPSTSAAASGAGVGAGAPTSSAGAVASTTKPTAMESHAAPAHHEAAAPAHHEAATPAHHEAADPAHHEAAAPEHHEAAAPEHHEAAAEPTRLE
jgi:hypothetical protein